MVDLTWVNAKGEEYTSSRYSAEGRALVGGVGLVGIITDVTLQLEPATFIRVDTPKFHASDRSLYADIQTMLKVRGRRGGRGGREGRWKGQERTGKKVQGKGRV